MKLREEMAERAIAAAQFGPATPENPPLSGWIVTDETWDDMTQNAVDYAMSYMNALYEMVLRLAEAVDELRDATDV